jgi:copper(I)-binding protein
MLAFSEDEGSHFTVAMVGSPKDKTFELVKLPADYAEAEPTEAAHSESKVGEATAGTLVISGAYVRATAAASGGMMATPAATQPAGGMGGMGGMGAVSAAYFQIKNTGDKADQLVSVTCDVAGVAELHMTTVKDNVAQMQPVSAVEVPANGSAELKPGGYHVMLMQLKKDLVAGQTVTLTLTFKSGARLTFTAPVKAP